MNVATGFGCLHDDLQDCPTWILVEKQPKTPYPPPPRFFLWAVVLVGLWVGFVAVLCVLNVRFVCWFVQFSVNVCC
jgi:hypothetical protein